MFCIGEDRKLKLVCQNRELHEDEATWLSGLKDVKKICREDYSNKRTNYFCVLHTNGDMSYHVVTPAGAKRSHIRETKSTVSKLQPINFWKNTLNFEVSAYEVVALTESETLNIIKMAKEWYLDHTG